MSVDTIRGFLDQYMSLYSGKMSFIWHGGEPLLVGIDFFREVVEIQNTYSSINLLGTEVQNSIQTNGTLVTPEWAAFFKENDFKVGVSLDGDPEGHNLNRKNAAGSGSFDRAVRGIEILRDAGIEPGVIQTLTTSNLHRTDEIYDFFRNHLGLKSWSVNVFNTMSSGDERMDSESVDSKQYTDYLKELIQLWLSTEDEKVSIREIDSHICSSIGRMPRNCSFNGQCTTFFCLEYDGRIYPCDRSSGVEDLLLGDLREETLEAILNGERKRSYDTKVNTVDASCRGCEWQKTCNNGCTMHRKGGIGGKYYYCESRKEIFEHVRNLLSEIHQ